MKIAELSLKPCLKLLGDEHNGNITRAAEKLGITRINIYQKLKKAGIGSRTLR